MEGVVRTARRAAMFFVAFASTGFGLLMIWILVRPGVIARVATVEMMVVLGLFLLPVATLAAWFMDHRAIAEQPAEESEEARDGAAAAHGEGLLDAIEVTARVPGRHAQAGRDEGSPRHAAATRRHRRPLGAGERV